MGKVAEVEVTTGDDVSAGRVVVGCLLGEAPPTEALPPFLADRVRRLAAASGWEGRDQQMLGDLGEGEGPFVALAGLGKADELTFPKLRSWIERQADQARVNGNPELALALPGHQQTLGDAAAERLLRVAALATYRFDRFRRSDEPRGPAKVQIVPPDGEMERYSQEASFAAAAAESTAFLRDLANMPGNEADPEWMAEEARKVADSLGMEADILGPDELAAKGMRLLLAVGGGSVRKPRLVRLAWGTRGPIVALVGKGVTFDTGGISIKPSASMEEMKFDKCGACTALAAAQAAARLELPIRLRVYLPLVENMPDGTAYRPGDIFRSYSGKTVEIINTDAEGRLILAEALAWAVEEEPDAMLEYATLTGACMVALGRHGAGLFTRDDQMAGELLEAATSSGEYLWRLPLWPEFSEEMKAHQADLKNSAGRWGGASQAAAFLHEFTGSFTRWAHLDIAGPAMSSSEADDKREATGYGLALTIRWLRGLGG